MRMMHMNSLKRIMRIRSIEIPGCRCGNLRIWRIRVIKRTMDKINKRLPLLLTEAELKAVEEWRFANKISSRNEAVRMLIKLGLKAAEKGEKVSG